MEEEGEARELLRQRIAQDAEEIGGRPVLGLQADQHLAVRRELGAADEQKPAKDGTVEAWARSPENPIGGWYGLRKGYRGRFGMYLPPLLEQLGLAELTHEKRNNRMRAR